MIYTVEAHTWPKHSGEYFLNYLLDGEGANRLSHHELLALYFIAQDITQQGQDDSADTIIIIISTLEGLDLIYYAERTLNLRRHDYDEIHGKSPSNDLIARITNSLDKEVIYDQKIWLHYEKHFAMRVMHAPATVVQPVGSSEIVEAKLFVESWPGLCPIEILDELIDDEKDPAMIIAWCFAMKQIEMGDDSEVSEKGRAAFKKFDRVFNLDSATVNVDQETADRLKHLFEDQKKFDRSSMTDWDIKAVPDLKLTNDLRIAYAYAFLFIEAHLIAIDEEEDADNFAYRLADDGLQWPRDYCETIQQMPIQDVPRSELYARLLILRKFRESNEITPSELAIFCALENGPNEEVFDLDIDTIFLSEEYQNDFECLKNERDLDTLKTNLRGVIYEGVNFDEMVIFQYWIHYIDTVQQFSRIEVVEEDFDDVFVEITPDGDAFSFRTISPLNDNRHAMLAAVSMEAEKKFARAQIQKIGNPIVPITVESKGIASVRSQANFAATITFLHFIPEVLALWNERGILDRFEGRQKEDSEKRWVEGCKKLTQFALDPLSSGKPNRCNVATLIAALNNEYERRY
ncbi:MAG: hypothetical protein P0S94_00935, partial [Simkaniaceae bacterium]|nr:hypothetical protein [Simkaniaceae bacterium]